MSDERQTNSRPLRLSNIGGISDESAHVWHGDLGSYGIQWTNFALPRKRLNMGPIRKQHELPDVSLVKTFPVRIIAILVLILLAIAVVVSGWINRAHVPKPAVVSNVVTAPYFSYAQYLGLCDQVAHASPFAGYHVIYNSTGLRNEDVIDSVASFDTRRVLTVDGKQSFHPTQNTIVFESKGGKFLIEVAVIYLRTNLDNDMVYWEDTPKDVAEQIGTHPTNLVILSFHNTLFHISFYTSHKAETDAQAIKEIFQVEEFSTYVKHAHFAHG